MSIDDEILEKADRWNREEQRTRRQAAERRHERWMAVGRFTKYVILVVGGLGMITFGGTKCAARCNADVEAAEDLAREQRVENRKLDAVYEPAWVECIEKLGLEKCTLVGERAVRNCNQCASQQRKSRLEMIEADGG